MNHEEYQALPITWADASLAYPLVYLHDASVSLDAWLEFVRQRVDADRDNAGLMVIRDRKGIVHALFSYRVDHDLKGSRQLGIAQLIVAQIPGSQIDQAVVAATSQIAGQLDCQSITVEQPFQLADQATKQAPSAA